MDWLEHLDQVTRFDGFLAALVEIRDGMVFYDRDLMLAGYTGNLEALIVSTLAEACMAGDEEASRAFAAVRQVVDELPERLAAPDDAPADVQAVVHSFLRVGAWVLRERVSAFLMAFDHYLRDDYDLRHAVDVLVSQAQVLVEQDPQRALELVGEVGALMLRGQFLRARWLSVVPPRLQLWLTGLRNMAGHLAATAQSFPWAAAQDQRRRVQAPRVVDLQAFRRRRMMALEAWRLFDTPRPRDALDGLVERIFEGPHGVDEATVSALAAMGEQPVPLLLGIARAAHLVDPQTGNPGAVCAAIRVLCRLRRHEVVPRLIELVTDPQTPEEVAVEARHGLEGLGALAVDGVSDYLRRVATPRGGPALARVLARLPRSEKTFRALVDLFQRVRWEDGKLAVATALAEYGDGRAVAVLEQALRDPQLPTPDHRRALQRVLRQLSGRPPARRRVAKG